MEGAAGPARGRGGQLEGPAGGAACGDAGAQDERGRAARDGAQVEGRAGGLEGARSLQRCFVWNPLQAQEAWKVRAACRGALCGKRHAGRHFARRGLAAQTGALSRSGLWCASRGVLHSSSCLAPPRGGVYGGQHGNVEIQAAAGRDDAADADTVRGAQADADEKSRKELGWKAAQENRLAWQEKLSNQQHERNRAVETKLVEQMRKNTSDLATNSLLEARMRAPRALPAPSR